MRNEIKDKVNLICKGLDELEQIVNSKLTENFDSMCENISKEELENLVYNEWQQVDDKVRYKRLEDAENDFHFVAEMKKGGVFKKHKHINLTEVTNILQGIITELHSGETYIKGDKVTIDKNVPHGYKCHEDATFNSKLNR